MDSFFKYCTFDNPIFKWALFWTTLLVISGAFTTYYKIQEAREQKNQLPQEKSPEAKKAAKVQAKPSTPAKAVTKPPVAEVKPIAAPVPKKVVEKASETKPKSTPKKVELKPVEVPKP